VTISLMTSLRICPGHNRAPCPFRAVLQAVLDEQKTPFRPRSQSGHELYYSGKQPGPDFNWPKKLVLKRMFSCDILGPAKYVTARWDPPSLRES
jgi:hypothetical protein